MDWQLIVIYIGIFLYGIVVGSFLNVCIYRLPKEESLITNGSHCMTCGAKIKKYDLIPLFSWLILRGKCRNCKAPIAWRYPFVEALNGILWCLCFMKFGFEWHTLFVMLLFSALVVVFFMDLDTQLISNYVVIFIALVAIGDYFVWDLVSIPQRLIGAVVISVPFLLINLLSKGRAMGMGDVYLMIAGGLFLGTKATLVAGFIGIFLAAIFGMINKYVKGESKFAFGPYLSLGIAIAAFYGTKIADMYLEFSGLA